MTEYNSLIDSIWLDCVNILIVHMQQNTSIKAQNS